MTYDRHQLTGSEVARGRSPLSLRQHLFVLISTTALLLACFVPMHLSLSGRQMSATRLGILIAGDTILIGMQIAALLALFSRWRRTRKEASESR